MKKKLKISRSQLENSKEKNLTSIMSQATTDGISGLKYKLEVLGREQ